MGKSSGDLIIKMAEQEQQPQAQRLLKRLQDFQRFYIKGFGHKVALLEANADYVFRNMANSKIRQESLDLLRVIEAAYSILPPAPEDRDFAPVVITQDILPGMARNSRQFFSAPEFDLLTEIRRDCVTIGRVGLIFRDSFEKVFQDLRKEEGFENYSFELTDLEGAVWTYNAGMI